jgi:hypothetical protein
MALNVKALDSTAAVNPAAALKLGYSAILRYLVGDSPLTKKEVETYTAANFGVGSAWELSGTAAQNGETLGHDDAVRAVAAAVALGQPKGITPQGTAIYAAVDFDPENYIPAIVKYFTGWAAVVRAAGYLAGGYVGAKGANACLGAGVLDRIWIPGATSWSDGAKPDRVDIQQGATQVQIDGVTCDTDVYDGTTPQPDYHLSTSGLWNGNGEFPAYIAPEGCFVAGTPVLASPGAPRSIESFAPGSPILAYDETARAFTAARVEKLHEHGPRPILELRVDGLDEGIRVTSAHRFLTPRGWTAVADLVVGDELTAALPLGQGTRGRRLLAVRDTGEREPVFNLTVTPHHTYLVHGLIVHNIKVS